MSRLALGTVQFGLEYGVANAAGRMPPETARRVVAAATSAGIDTFDTSPAYGSSEEALGDLLPRGSRIITKVPRLAGEGLGADSIEACGRAFATSLARLRVPAVDGLLVHWADDLLKEGSERLWDWMEGLKSSGKVRKIGVSIYHAGQIDAILARFPVELVQVPLNAVDQRLLASGHLAGLKARGVEIHVRSVFLQGLLLMGIDSLPAYFRPWRDTLAEFHGEARDRGLSPLELALAFVLGRPEVDRAVVGVDSEAHLLEIVRASRAAIDPLELAGIASSEAALLNPSLWKFA